MELNRQERIFDMLYAFIAAIIRINKPGLEIRRECSNGKAMILRGDIAALRPIENTGLVLTSMSILQLIGVTACGKRQQLMTEADSERGNAMIHNGSDGANRFVCHFGI